MWEGATTMKRLVIFLTIAGVLSLCLIVAIVVRDLKHRTWMEYTPGEIDRLAVGVEAFREEQGAYLGKLSELQTVPGLHDKEYLSEILAGKSGNQYQYRTVSNGFVITVTKSARLFSKDEVMEKFFKPGETLGGEVKTVIPLESGATNGVPHKR
jgi:hypothetical protein